MVGGRYGRLRRAEVTPEVAMGGPTSMFHNTTKVLQHLSRVRVVPLCEADLEPEVVVGAAGFCRRSCAQLMEMCPSRVVARRLSRSRSASERRLSWQSVWGPGCLSSFRWPGHGVVRVGRGVVRAHAKASAVASSEVSTRPTGTHTKSARPQCSRRSTWREGGVLFSFCRNHCMAAQVLHITLLLL